MSKITFEPPSKPFEIPEANQYPARMFDVLEIGEQIGEYKGKETRAKKLLISYELSGARNSDGNPFVIQSEITKSVSPMGNLVPWAEAALRRNLTQDELAGNFDIESILDKPVMVEVVHSTSSVTGRTNARIEARSVTKLPPQMMNADPLVNPISVRGFPKTKKEFDALSKWERQKVEKSVGWNINDLIG